MMEIGVFEAKNKLSTLLDRVEKGEEIIITRHGRPVARLVPYAGGFDRSQVQAAIQRIRGRVTQVKDGPFDWEVLKVDRDLDRR